MSVRQNEDKSFELQSLRDHLAKSNENNYRLKGELEKMRDELRNKD